MFRILCFLTFFFASILVAQEAAITEADTDFDIKETLRLSEEALVEASRQIDELQAFARQSQYDPVIYEGYQQAWLNHYRHEEALRMALRKTLQYQRQAGYLVLFLVLAVAGFGVYMSSLEIRSAIGLRDRAFDRSSSAVDTVTTLNVLPTSEFVAEIGRLEIKSAITGVVILVVSLGFLSLYLANAFKVEPLDFLSVSVPSEPVLDSVSTD